MIKRGIDIGAAFFGLLLLSPILVIVGVFIRFKLGSPILFRQDRPGLNGEIFTIIKFRTMTNETDLSGAPLPDEKRLTRFGQWLRSTSIDELPELWNVLRGNMSLVGPRPLRVDYLERYSTTQARRHEVRPGITGVAQVRGRNALSWEQKFDLDVWYVDNRSILLDLKILWETVSAVCRRSGISADGSVTMPPFGPKEH